ncbi:MAG TPA: cysteine peptidase family C39 domain-containing protein [Puia sp.]|nr:cysteine peptidase family C39 domain-containing protein [Puia sp.]
MDFPFYRQTDINSCGINCLQMVAQFHKKEFFLSTQRSEDEIRRATNMGQLVSMAERLGFTTLAAKLTTNSLVEHITLPCIIHWNLNHYVVLYRIEVDRFYIADPALGFFELSKKRFNRSWLAGNKKKGIVLVLSP